MINPLDLSGKTVLITGASSGIGRQAAILLSQLGARIVLTGRDMSRLQETQQLLEGAGHEISVRDLSAVESLPAWLREIAQRTGPLHGLVHCAALSYPKGFRFMEYSEISTILRTNLDSALMLAQGFRQKTVHSTGASLVFLASIAGLVGLPGVAAYSASKGGIIAATRALAVELVRDGIRVNALAPGWVLTAMTLKAMESFAEAQVSELRARHLLGFGEPQDVANAIAFLLADTSRWITGTTLVVDGGYTIQ
jgi:NAD(P)-dependent dehydrogenase (short-subunit alcohol dehydrogenase family)